MSRFNQGLQNLSPEKRSLLEARLLQRAVLPARKEATISRRDPAKPARLSFAQEQFWFFDQIHPGTPTYTISEVLRLRGPLNLTALQGSLSELLVRHEGLRTTLGTDLDEPVQTIHPPQPVQLSVVELAGFPESKRFQEACRLANEEARRPFALSTGPLIRFQVARLSEDDWMLAIHLHHSISDGWSVGVMMRELGELYGAFVQGRAARLPELAVQYADFAQWQREWLEATVCKQQLAYWKTKLAGAPECLTLPSDRPRPVTPSFSGGYHSIVVARALADELQALGRQQGATLFMTLLAVFDVLLLRYTGQEDLVIGSPVAGRNLVEVENIVGCFVNMVVLRTDASGNCSFRELLRRARETATSAFANQDAPFEKLVEVLRPARTPSYNPLFQVALILQNAPGEDLQLPGLALSRLPVGTGTSKFDLTLFAWEKSDGLHLGIEFSSDLFDDATILRMLGHLQQLIQGVVADPDCRIRQLPLLTERERHQMLVAWNDEVRRDYLDKECIHELFESQVLSTPEAVAVIDGHRRLTYREVNHRANQVAALLRLSGVGPEVLVGVCLERSAEMVVALLGILKAGGAYVPLDPDYPKDRVTFMLEDTRAAVLLTQRSLERLLPQSDSKVIYIDEIDWAQAGDAPLDTGRDAQSTNVAYVIYTSGSTGRPKGVAIEHRSAVVLIRWAREVFTREELTRVLFSTSICFDLSVYELFVTLGCGGCVVVAQNVLSLPALPAREEVTLINTVPSAMTELVRLKALPPSVQVVNLAGEPLRALLVDQIYALGHVKKVYDLYGPSEDTTYSTFALRLPNAPATIGRPIANTQVYVLDTYLEPVPVGVTGEIHLGGAGLARGYLNRPELTVEKFIPNPFNRASASRLYRTGDLGRYRSDGNLEYLGRADHQVKVRGFRIELGEIESVLCQHPAIRAAVVVAREGESGDKRLVAYLVAPPPAPDSLILQDYLKRKLPEYMVPAFVVYLAELPLTSNGKIDRKALPEPEQQRPQLEAAYVAPQGETEKLLAEIWSRVLHVPQVGRHDNFFELGGHSLLVLRAASRIRQHFSVEIPLAVIFETPTIAALAGKLSDLQVAAIESTELARMLDEVEANPGPAS